MHPSRTINFCAFALAQGFGQKLQLTILIARSCIRYENTAKKNQKKASMFNLVHKEYSFD